MRTKMALLLLLPAPGAFLLPGCGTPPPPPMEMGEVRAAVLIHDPRVREIVPWGGFVDRAEGADIVILGEWHDDHVAHLVQRALVEDLVDRSPDVVVAMEMLERDEQHLVDDYREGLIGQDEFSRETGSASWAGEGSWNRWYLPIIDAAHDGGARVVAANAPRRYVRTARTDGWDRLERLPEERRQLVVWPEPPLEGAYKERFVALMGEHAGGEDDELVESMFRAQTTWDATMADSVAQHHSPGGTTVLLLGQFHSNLDGGTIQMLRRYMPDASLLVVCLRRDQGDPPDDPPPADLIVETSSDPR